tara:strand:- start:34 stop:603 length:570 start_codon:yes stop_codon:yes gene_type:complete
MILSKLIPNGQFNNAFEIEESSELKLASMEQSHSDIFIEVDKPGVYQADALITKQKNLVLAVKTADCMPILISDSEKVGVVHIGWRGLENKIFYKTIANFDITNLKVSIGPHAQKCCYEIKEDLEVKLSKHCFKQKNKIYLDLTKDIKEFCKSQKIDLEINDECTIENEKYNSFRRNKTIKRQLSKVWI